MSKSLRVLHFTTHNEDCGIGRYQEHFLDAMELDGRVYNEVFPYSPNVTKDMSSHELTRCLAEMQSKLKDFDLLHVQYELSFFKNDELRRILSVARKATVKSVVTVHTSPDALYRPPHLQGYGLRSWLRYVKHLRDAKAFRDTYVTPLALADLILVHNQETKRTLVGHKIEESKIHIIILPVPSFNARLGSVDVAHALKKEPGDIIIAAVGFVSPMKQLDHAVKALKFLPENYKLAILGGVHPNGDPQYLNQISDLIIDLGIAERVYMTGYIDDDDHLDALIRECDICVYPYERQYYAYVSSAALSLALANYRPAIVYPTKPFLELNQEDAVLITRSFTYYELAQTILALDRPAYTERAKHYALQHSYKHEADKLVDIYEMLVKSASALV